MPRNPFESRASAARIVESVRSSLLAFPAALVTAAVVAAIATIWMDRHLAFEPGMAWLYVQTGPHGALATVSAIAGSVMTVGGVTFSITIVVLQLASSQFSPRVVRTFLRDRLIQLVIGWYVATFVYVLLVLRTIHVGSDAEAPFVPALSILVAVLAALVAMALLIGFLHHVAHAIQVPSIVDAIAAETRARIAETCAPAADTRPPGDEPPPELAEAAGAVHAPVAGYVEYLDCELLRHVPGLAFVRFEVCVGAYVHRGDVLARFQPPSEDTARALVAAFSIHRERSVRQDIDFGLRMIADIAVRALSPGVNDPTTAVYCLNTSSDLLCGLAERHLPPERGRYGEVHVLRPQPRFADLLATAFSQATDYGRADPDVVRTIVRSLRAIAARDVEGRHAGAIAAQLARVRDRVSSAGWYREDLARLADELAAAEAARRRP